MLYERKTVKSILEGVRVKIYTKQQTVLLRRYAEKKQKN